MHPTQSTLCPLSSQSNLGVQRFDGHQAKVDEHVRFPVTLDMTPYTTHTISRKPDARDCTYDLFAIVSHLGQNIHKGHYINYAKFNGEWFAFNDHTVEWVPEETVLQAKAYRTLNPLNLICLLILFNQVFVFLY